MPDFNNIRLIATAPEMYEALKKCVEFIENVVCGEGYDCTYEAEDMRDYIEGILARIDGSKEEDKAGTRKAFSHSG